MSNLWPCLEILAGGNHVAAEWAKLAGEQFAPLRSAFLRDTQKRARFIPCPCPHGCGCEHEICERKNGVLVALCRCEPRSCDDFAVTAEQATLLELNTAKLGRAIAKAFDCDARAAALPLPLTWQIGAKFSNGVPVVLTIQNNRESFRHVVAELSARQRQRFILFAPTSRWLDAASRELLESAKAGFFDLESNLNISENGHFTSKLPPGKMLQAFAPDTTEPDGDDVVRQAWGLLERLDDGKEPSLVRVFRLYGKMEKTAEQVANDCGCAKGTVINRLKAITKKTGLKPADLRRLSGHIGKIESEIEASGAKRIHRKALVHDVKENDYESE
jgi:hypothetical protein